VANFQETMIKLQQVLSRLEDGSTSIEDVAEDLKQGFELMAQLQQKLQETEAHIENIIKLEQKNSNEQAE